MISGFPCERSTSRSRVPIKSRKEEEKEEIPYALIFQEEGRKRGKTEPGVTQELALLIHLWQIIFQWVIQTPYIYMSTWWLCVAYTTMEGRQWCMQWTNHNPVNTRYSTNAGGMLAQRLRRLANIPPALVDCVLFLLGGSLCRITQCHSIHSLNVTVYSCLHHQPLSL